MIETISFKVNCKRDPYKVRTCYIIAHADPGKPNRGYPNGCEDMSGDPACIECARALGALYNSGAVMPDEPISL